MCGIIGILSRRPTRPVPTQSEVVELLDAAADAIRSESGVVAATEAIRAVDSLLKGLPGVILLSDRRELVSSITTRLDQLSAAAVEIDQQLEAKIRSTDELEHQSALSIDLRDALWSVSNDRLRTADKVGELAGRDAGEAALAAYLAVQQALSAIDRLEVRGRDSAGIHIFVSNHDLDLADPTIAGLIAGRNADPMFQSGSVRVADGVLSFVYKASAEIGDLGDNTHVLRTAIADDDLFRRSVTGPDATVAVLGHTRWASVGIISGAEHPPA